MTSNLPEKRASLHGYSNANSHFSDGQGTSNGHALTSNADPNSPSIAYQLIGLLQCHPPIVRPLLQQANQNNIPTRTDFPEGSSEGCIIGAAHELARRDNEAITPAAWLLQLDAWASREDEQAEIADQAARDFPHLFAACPAEATEENALQIALDLTQRIKEQRPAPRQKTKPLSGAAKASRPLNVRVQQGAPSAVQGAADNIPAPTLRNDRGQVEYSPRQIVELLHPDWPVTSLETHAAHARRIIENLGEDLRYCPQLGWLFYNEFKGHWEKDDRQASAIAGRIAPLSRLMRAESGELYNYAGLLAATGRQGDAEAMGRAAATLLRHAKQAESKTFIDGALHLTAGALKVDPSAFDQKPWLIGFQNGTWCRGKWREHRREDYLLNLSPTLVDFNADRAEWNAVRNRITRSDSEYEQTLQDTAGYVLSGASHLRAIPWLYGPKGTGKSTYSELLQTVLGEMSITIDPKKLQDDAARERLGADFWNKRLGVCAEAGSQKIESEILKTLAGGDRLPVRFLYCEAFTAPPRHVLMMVANDPPRMDAYDQALRDRVVALPFIHPLSEPEPITLTGGARVEAVRQDPTSALVAGFVAWALEGLSRVFKTQEIHRAPVVEKATKQFWEDTDPLTAFWEAFKRPEDTPADWKDELKAGITKSELRKRYDDWCEAEGIHQKARLGRIQWARACKSFGLDEVRIGEKGTRGWVLTQLTQLGLFSKSPCEDSKATYRLFENKPSCVSCVSNDDGSEVL